MVGFVGFGVTHRVCLDGLLIVLGVLVCWCGCAGCVCSLLL